VTGSPQGGGLTFDRHMVLEQLGGWRGMLDASLPIVAFIVANGIGGLTVGIWAAVVAAVLVFLLRLLRKESIQQAISGLFAVAVAVVIAARTGEARDFFVLGIVRNAAIGVVVLGSLLVRRPLVGVVAEFLAPSHLGTMSSHRLPSLRSRLKAAPLQTQEADTGAAAGAERGLPDAQPERHWREDRRMLRAYSWLTVMWGGVFLLRAVVQWVLYLEDDVGLLGTSSVVLGLPVTAIELVVTLWVVSRLHRHRSETEDAATGDGDGQQRPAA
jgi:FtsH-binding integral membrane protein